MLAIKKYIVATATMGLLISPLAASATNLPPRPDRPDASNKTLGTENFCTRITATTSELNGMLTKLGENRGKIRTNMLNNLSERKTKRAEEVRKFRSEFQSKFAKHLDKLGSNATTDEQKAALADFKSAVSAAQATRKAAVDAAIAAYTTAAQQTITDRESKVKDAATTFQTAVTAAIAQAKTDCANGVAPGTARQTMYTSIQTANKAFRDVVTALPDGTLVNLAKTRDAAIRAANKAFRDAVKAAADVLKAALGA